MMRDGTAESVSRDQILKRERGANGDTGDIHFQLTTSRNGKPYTVRPYFATSDDYMYMKTSTDLCVQERGMDLTYSRWTSSLPSCLWSLRIFPSLPDSRLTIFYRDASLALLQLVNK